MELGTLELQIFVSLIVILGTAFVALVCDYLKGNNESLREHNIELRVRKEEQEKNRGVEAVEWLQHLLGATQRNPVRMAGMRTPNRKRPAAATPAAPANGTGVPAKPAAAAAQASPNAPATTATPAVTPARPPVRRPVPAQSPAIVTPEAPIPALAQSPSFRTMSPPAAPQRIEVAEQTPQPQPSLAGLAASVAPVTEFNAPPSPLVAEASEPAAAENREDAPRGGRFAAARLRREAERRQPPASLLESLPVPAWVKKEQEEKAALAAGASRSEEPVREQEPVRPAVVPLIAEKPVEAPIPAAAESSSYTWTYVPSIETAEPSFAAPAVAESAVASLVPAPVPAAPKADSFWSYRGLVDRMVAATNNAFGPRQETATPEPFLLAPAPPVDEAESAPIATVMAEVLQQPTAAEVTTVQLEAPAAEAPESEQPVVTLDPVVVEDSHAEREAAYFSVLLESLPEPAKEPVIVYAAEPPLLTQAQPQTSTVIPFSAPVAFEASPSVNSSPLPALELPAGFHDRSVLNSFLQSSDVLTGVVVAIGINDYPHHTEKLGHAPMQDLMRNVEQMIGGMLRPNLDFGCRSTDDEFILVFVDEVGSDAQRRLSTISERLWNFQLRSLSNFSVLFSWGAVEVQNETLADAAASASERMYQTKRNRKTVTLDTQRRKIAVNL